MRVPPLPADQWDDAVDRALAVHAPRGAAQPGEREQHPRHVRQPSRPDEGVPAFNVHLLFRSTLPPRLRELAILRVAHRTDCDYEWVHHVKHGPRDGPDRRRHRRRPARRGRRRLRPRGADGGRRTPRDATNSPTRRGRRSASTSTSGSAWTSSSRSAATSHVAMALNTFGVRARTRRGRTTWHFSRSRPRAAGPRTGRNSAPRRSTTRTPSTRSTSSSSSRRSSRRPGSTSAGWSGCPRRAATSPARCRRSAPARR